MVAFVDGHEADGVDGSVYDVEVVFGEAQGFEQLLPDRLGAIGIHFQPDGFAFAPIAQLFLDGLEQVVRVVLGFFLLSFLVVTVIFLVGVAVVVVGGGGVRVKVGVCQVLVIVEYHAR